MMLNQVHVIHSVDAKVCIVAKHGLIVEVVILRAALRGMREEGFAAPQVFIQGHDQEAGPGILANEFLAQALGELAPYQPLGSIGSERGDHRQVGKANLIDRSQNANF